MARSKTTLSIDSIIHTLREEKVILDAIRQLMAPPEAKKRRIGFLVEEKAAVYRRR